MSPRPYVALFAALTAGFLLAADVALLEAQGIRMPRREGMKLTPMEASGTVQGVMPPQGRNPGVIKLLSTTNQTWYAQVPNEATVHVTGLAEPEILDAGLFVQFTASVNTRRGTIEGKVNDLLIFTPSHERMPGAFPAGMGGAVPGGEGPRPGAGFRPGVGPGINPGVGPGVGPGINPGAGPGVGPGAGPGAETALLDVGGRISRIRGNTLSVLVPNFNPRLQVELTEQPTIRIDVNMYWLAQEGDKIEIRGWMVGQGIEQGNQVGYAKARDVKIELAKPLGPPEKKPRTRPTRPPRTKPKPKEPKPEDPETEDPKPGAFGQPVEPER